MFYKSRVGRAVVSVAAATTLVTLSACGGGGSVEKAPTGGPQVTTQEEWDEIVAAAKDEGQLTIYWSLVGSDALFDEFKKDYPEINVTIDRAATSDIVSRLDQEIQVDAPGADLTFHAQEPWFTNHSAEGNLAAISLSPEAAELGWEERLGGKEFAKTYAYPYLLGYNSATAEPVDGVADLLDNAGDAKIGLLDAGAAIATSFQYDQWAEQVGPDFLSRLSGLNSTVESSTSTLSQGLASGQYDYVVGMIPGLLSNLAAQGAPVEEIVPSDAQTGPQYSITALVAAQHPNAAQVFINWLISEEGQQQIIDSYSPGSVPLDVQGSIPWGQIQSYDPAEWDMDSWNEWIANEWRPAFG